MLVRRLFGAFLSASMLGGCLLLGWDFDKEPPLAVTDVGGGGSGPIEPEGVVILGQPDGEEQVNLRGGLWGSVGAAHCDDRLIVADSNNHRVLIYDDVQAPPDLPAEPSWVLGQPDMISAERDHGGVRAQSLDFPYAVACRNGGPLVVADANNHRVLVWLDIPANDQVAADVVVGQDDFTSSGTNSSGSNVGPAGFGFPGGVALDDQGRLAVSDSPNNRVLIWNTMPTRNGAAADVVVGQPDFASKSPGAGDSRFDLPETLAFSQGRLAVSDFKNNRVLMWNTVPDTNGAPASLVVGQVDFSGTNRNAGGDVSALGFDGPGGIAFANDTLAVSDWRNHRVLVWDPVPVDSGESATRHLGQSSPTVSLPNSPTVDASSFWFPWGLAADSGRVYVVDDANHRVTAFDAASDYAPLGVVAGQATSADNAAFAGGGIHLGSLHFPHGLDSDGERLVVVDLYAHRVSLWDSVPTADDTPAVRVLGQATPTVVSGVEERPTADHLIYPRGAHLHGEQLLVSDSGNHRVVVWQSMPTEDGQPADVVIGQASMTEGAPNRGGSPTANTLSTPTHIEVVAGKLLVADSGNNRVLVYDEVPDASDADASIVLGQDSFTEAGDGIGPAKLRVPRAVVSDGQAIYVADTINRRVLVWDETPSSNGVAADYVVGQPDFETASTDVIDARTIHRPMDLALRDGHLFVADENLHRVMVFALPITESFPAATHVLGQPDFNTAEPNVGGRRRTTFDAPSSLAVIGDRLAIGDAHNSRVALWPLEGVLD